MIGFERTTNPNEDVVSPQVFTSKVDNIVKPIDNESPSYAFQLMFWTIQHPIDYAKIMIQIGYEPRPMKTSSSEINKCIFKLPEVFSCIKQIKSVDGFNGCFRGLFPKLIGNVVANFSHKQILSNLEENEAFEGKLNCPGPETENLENDQEIFFEEMRREIISRSIAIVASHPFHVITVRMMAQFIGREVKYRCVFSSIGVIFKEEGIFGFFNGLFPRFIGELSAFLISKCLTHYCCRYFAGDKEWQVASRYFLPMLANKLTNPFTVVSNCTTLQGSGLVASLPPNMPTYTNWLDCWSNLSQYKKLNRGSSF